MNFSEPLPQSSSQRASPVAKFGKLGAIKGSAGILEFLNPRLDFGYQVFDVWRVSKGIYEELCGGSNPYIL